MSQNSNRHAVRYNRQASVSAWLALESAEWHGRAVCQAQEQEEADYWYYYDDMLRYEAEERESDWWHRHDDDYYDRYDDDYDRYDDGPWTKEGQVEECWNIYDEFWRVGAYGDALYDSWVFDPPEEPRYPDAEVAWSFYQEQAEKVKLDIAI